MFLSITTTHSPARDLSFLLHKHPDHVHVRELTFGNAYVLYPEATDALCTAVLTLDIDPVRLSRRPDGSGEGLAYVNDRPYAASSFLSVAISRAFGSAFGGRSRERQELADTAIPLEATIAPLFCAGGLDAARKYFEPLGYIVDAETAPLNARFPSWGQAPHLALKLSATVRLADLLNHLYILIPVLDDEKHYSFGNDEIEKLLEKGGAWLKAHPLRELIVKRYLGQRRHLFERALDRLSDGDAAETHDADEKRDDAEQALERPISLNEQRLDAVVAAVLRAGGGRVIDLGCGEGKLLRRLLKEPAIGFAFGVDVSTRSLEIAARRLKLDEMAPRQRERVEIAQAALTYRDRRFENFDTATLVEVIEHLDRDRVDPMARVVFGFARPRTVVMTTPNREYNALFPGLPGGAFRHADHRFEWTRAEFEAWARATAATYGYDVTFSGIGVEDPIHGAPTQMGVFQRCA